jgi:uracil-DNA glycosylase family 4
VTADRKQALEEIAAEVRVCTRCRLHQGRTRAVPGEGHPETEVVFVGEGPGYNEDQQGRPFVGAAGGLLAELVRSVGWERDEVFITNVVKCRPPGNRDPEPDEIAACRPYLERQLRVLDPALVVTLGRFSMNTFMPGARISSAHGTVRPVDPATGAGDALAYAMYHPAAAFRQNALKETLRADMAGIPEVLLRAREMRREHAAARGVVEGVAPSPVEPVAVPVAVAVEAERASPVEPVAVAVEVESASQVEAVVIPVDVLPVAVPIDIAPPPGVAAPTEVLELVEAAVAAAGPSVEAAVTRADDWSSYPFDGLELAPAELPPPPDDPRDQLSLF